MLLLPHVLVHSKGVDWTGQSSLRDAGKQTSSCVLKILMILILDIMNLDQAPYKVRDVWVRDSIAEKHDVVRKTREATDRIHPKRSCRKEKERAIWLG
jgi:hypothetical protein